ncbi:hypothetical protein [Pseudomonas tohonis]|uniref:hypothetical protein n=1 Tax=Pseudomonas tohonis TaxID=2725477 RepID=UPI001F41AFC9|nr:hypothetical protein [Pseudomonas tohonis]
MPRKNSTAGKGAPEAPTATAEQQATLPAGAPGAAAASLESSTSLTPPAAPELLNAAALGDSPTGDAPVLVPPVLDGAAPTPGSSPELPAVGGATLNTATLGDGLPREPEGPGATAGAADTAPGAASQQVAGADRHESEEIEALFIRAVPEQGWRRCGQRFTREGHGIALSLLSEADVDALCNDPNLLVEYCTIPTEEQH